MEAAKYRPIELGSDRSIKLSSKQCLRILGNLLANLAERIISHSLKESR